MTGFSGLSLLTTTHCELAASIECSVGLKQPGPHTTGFVGVGVGVGTGVEVAVAVGVGASVGFVNPGGSPIAVGVGDGV